jgi:DNA-binding MarR family transcriptional regulator
MKEVETMQSAGGDKKYLNALFSILRKTESISLAVQKTRFNTTELRLIGEILNAKYIGKRLISTQLAKIIGVTRSAVSQIVNNLEQQGVVRRVPDEIDRKIAYVEISEEMIEAYGQDLENCKAFVKEVVDEFGEERFTKMSEAYEEFIALTQKKYKEKA